jgi:hypothetical protein
MTGQKADRESRLKAALRENLRKRKAQERAIEGGGCGPEADGSAPAER